MIHTVVFWENKLQTETEKNIQKGVEFTLRGIYSAFRNPRSHTKHVDKEEDADAIIIFINHLLKLIDKSKGKFSWRLLLLTNPNKKTSSIIRTKI